MIVGISGKKGAGKDTLANMLGWPVKHFADPLKELVAGIVGIPTDSPKDTPTAVKNEPVEWLEDHLRETVLTVIRDSTTYGEALQKVGTDVFRKYDPEYWVKKAKGYQNVVIADVRFPNELDICDLTIRINRANRPTDGRSETHPSETALDNAEFNIVINNDGDLEELKEIAAFIKTKMVPSRY